MICRVGPKGGQPRMGRNGETPPKARTPRVRRPRPTPQDTPVPATLVAIPVPVPAAVAAPVTGAHNPTPISTNGWGYDSTLPIHYHEDGPIGTAVRHLGPDRQIDYDGLPLGEHLGRTATDVVLGRRTAAEGLAEIRRVRDRLPEGRARRTLDTLVDELDGPDTPCPVVADSVPGPIRQLVADLHAVPLVRRDPSREMGAVLSLAKEITAGRYGPHSPILTNTVRRIANGRHESLGAEGKYDIDRAVTRAVAALDADREAYRKARQGAE